ncbi:MAG: hypothetical protein ABS68_05080 [Niastella sp. SCN 39-18]|nr:MAG: hypothetical protein ABS68_05080 [Niastella sp. SCN 39-18]OJW09286.1 MAG: hypothetical protein BGO53_02385 [Sphingobacteriales bacterium 39-19]
MNCFVFFETEARTGNNPGVCISGIGVISSILKCSDYFFCNFLLSLYYGLQNAGIHNLPFLKN